jgi:hypothetical protein
LAAAAFAALEAKASAVICVMLASTLLSSFYSISEVAILFKGMTCEEVMVIC